MFTLCEERSTFRNWESTFVTSKLRTPAVGCMRLSLSAFVSKWCYLVALRLSKVKASWGTCLSISFNALAIYNTVHELPARNEIMLRCHMQQVRPMTKYTAKLHWVGRSSPPISLPLTTTAQWQCSPSYFQGTLTPHIQGATMDLLPHLLQLPMILIPGSQRLLAVKLKTLMTLGKSWMWMVSLSDM